MPDPAGLASLLDLPATTLRAIAESLETGNLRHGVTTGLLEPFAGTAAPAMAAVFRSLMEDGCSSAALAQICRSLHSARRRLEEAEDSIYLALSGPEVAGTPVVDTATVVRSLFEEAKKEVLLTSYVFHSAREILAPLAKRLDADPEFRGRIIVDLTHQRQGEEPLPIVANRFKAQFLSNHWDGHRQPEFWHDGRKFATPADPTAGIMHAKMVIIDQSAALITSANFTKAAQIRNIEAGILLRQHRNVARLKAYFDGLISTGALSRIH